MTIVYLDANVILRYVLGDVPAMARQVDTLIRRAERGRISVRVLPLVALECVQVLESFYNLDRVSISQLLIDFFTGPGMHTADDGLTIEALRAYRFNSVDFVDCYLACLSNTTGSAIATFDKKLLALGWVTAYSW